MKLLHLGLLQICYSDILLATKILHIFVQENYVLDVNDILDNDYELCTVSCPVCVYVRLCFRRHHH